jgi:iron(III) transport system substrate-binding protein
LPECQFAARFQVMKPSRKPFLAFAAVAAVTSFFSAHADVLNIYAHRHYTGDQAINRLFTEKTGIKVNVVNADADQLIERLKTEGANSPADVLVTVDAGRLQRAKAEGLLQPVDSEILKNSSPAGLRDAEGFWYPYTLRARVILAAKDRVKAGEIKTYEDLAKPEWRGRLLARSSSSSYNHSLLASVVTAKGKDEAAKWAKSVVSNFARPPQGGDRDQIKAVASGLADVCISNTYYLGLLLNSKDEADRKAGESVTVIFPNQDDRGAHCNISGVGVTKHSKNAAQAKAYIEFLVSPEVQKMIANSTYEHPINGDITLSSTHQSWGKFKIDTETFPKMSESQPEATRIFDQAGWK